MIEGALSRAIWKRFETSFSLSPIHFETRSDEETLGGGGSKPASYGLITNIINNRTGEMFTERQET
jgi:hypothetical protein